MPTCSRTATSASFSLSRSRADFTLIGTTDVACSGRSSSAAISADEEDYLLELAGRFFAKPLTRDDIVWRYAGVRPLLDDGSADPSAVSRDYHLDLAAGPDLPPLLNVIGGKITTYRRLAEAVLAKLEPHIAGWARPGRPARRSRAVMSARRGSRPIGSIWRAAAPASPCRLLARLARLYGTRTDVLLGAARTPMRSRRRSRRRTDGT